MHLSLATFSQILSSLTFLLLNIYFARELGLERYGKYALLLGSALFISTINGACVQQAILSQQYEDRKIFFHSARLLNFLTIITLIILTVTIVHFFEFSGLAEILIIFVPYSLKEFIKKELAANSDFLTLCLLEVITSLVLVGFCFTLYHTEKTLNPEMLLGCSYIIVLTLFVRKLFPNFKYVKFREINQIITFIRWVFPATLIGMVGLPALPLVLGAFVGVEQVGIFRASQNIFGMSNLLNQVYDSWLQPKSRNSNDVRILVTAQKLNIIGILALALIVPFIWRPLFAAVYGSDFLSHTQFNTYLVFAIFTTFSASVVLSVERIRVKIFGNPTNLLKSALINMFVSLIGYFVLIINDGFSVVFYFLTSAMMLSAIYLFLSERNFQNEQRDVI